MDEPAPASLPADAVELGRVRGAWGIRGWISVQAHSASPEALFSAPRWYLQAPEPGPGVVFSGCEVVTVQRVREHGRGLLAQLGGVDDRNRAESFKGARIFVARSDFPPLGEDEYYWVDLIGLEVVNREGISLGRVSELLDIGPQQTLVLRQEEGGKTVERMIPFVAAYVDAVDRDAGQIRVDWQPDY